MSKYFQLSTRIAIILLTAGVLFYACSGNEEDRSANSATASNEQEPRQIEILKYSDYSCPACKLYIPLQEQLKRDFGDNITITYRHFPLGGFQHSELAARSVEAAGEQGMKKEMHDKVFEGQEIWSNGDAESIFRGYAVDLGLDMEQFENDLNSERIRETVQRQRAEGERRMVQSTPTFFINGQRVRQNPQNYEQFRSIVEMYMYQ